MSIINWAILFVCMLIPVLVILMAFLEALGKLPGWRRRLSGVKYTGEDRRCPARQKCPQGSTCMGPVECIYHPLFSVPKQSSDPDTADRSSG